MGISIQHSAAGGAGGGVTAYEPQVLSSISKSLASLGSTDIVNVTEAGILLIIGIKVTTNIGGPVDANLDITVDGGTTRSLPLYAVSIFTAAIQSL
ncbi:MAG: hypothetical protein J3T61_09025, partial [Candidatus Brocadiales bacterium]|nr:hypothetical protein [Candidatus Bathyanammoxibius sp.]